ncbi:aldolase/citrate lyase family protein [Psychrobacter immobilis]|uniref:aldolase/citrate lyase family protein n=1 Tax=Psychrobacter immobilis TaxID=498 RepID=UPI00191A10DF|nr:aldolase/citrate lyase family protein [Psychrobacter immobilis]
MKIPINQFKKNLLAHQRQIGLFLGLGDAYIAEVLATAEFDWLLIDGEHGPNDVRSIRDQLQVLAAYPEQQIVVRLPDHNTATIKRVLDIGAQTLMIPMIETAQQAENLVKAMHYPPNGIRGVGTAMARAARWNAINDYFCQADTHMCLIAQIESVAGINNLADIVNVNGVDAVFIGPSDLAASMGHLGNPSHPEVKQAVADAIRDIVNAGKAAGIFSADPSVAQEYEKLGASFMLVGVDVLLLRKAATELANKFKGKAVKDASSY